MCRLTLSLRFAGLFVTVTAVAAAQAPPKLPPPVRNVGPVVGTLDSVFTTVSTVRTLSTGQLVVLDVRGQQVMFVEPDLKTWTVIADSTLKTARTYSGNGGLIPYHGDTTLFVDTRGYSFITIDPQGKLGRVFAIPRPNEANYLTGGSAGFPGFDRQGRLVYRGRPAAPPSPTRVGSDGFAEIPPFPDQYPLVRVDVATRKVDTASFVKVAATQMAFVRTSEGAMAMTGAVNPLPVADDWAILPDGTIAVLRVLDYHVDFVRANTQVTAGPKIPFDWEHFDDARKIAFIDSTKAALQLLNPKREYRVADAKERAPAEMFGLNPDGTKVQRPAPSQGNAGAAAASGADAARTPAPVSFTAPVIPIVLMSPELLPDFAPPFGPGATRVDLDGRLWVRTSVTMGGSPLYHVIDANGVLVDRVLIPSGRVIAGFGPKGVVYMGVRDGAWTRLERATLAPKR